MTTIEGGMICTDSKEIYELARMFRSHGMTREASKETHEKYAKEDVNPGDSIPYKLIKFSIL